MLIIDDEYDPDIKEAVRQLLLSGVPVQYWSGKGSAKFPNTRVVLLDLILRKGDADRTAVEKFDLAVEALLKVGSASIVIIFTGNPDQPSDFKARLEFKLKGEYPGIIAESKIAKREVRDREILISRIEQEITAHPEVKLALLLESIIDWAKDGAFQATIGRNAQTVKALVKIIDKQSGGAGPRRELVDTVIRVLSRHAHSGEAYSKLKEVLGDLFRDGPPDLTHAGAELLSFLMYYNPHGEQVWTGDIFRRRRSKKDIGVVITPSCDLAWDKPKYVSIAMGFALTEQVYADRSSILFQTDSKLRAFAATEQNGATGGERGQATQEIESRIRQYKDDERPLKLPESSYFLRHVAVDGGLVDIYLDLKDIERVPLASLGNKRGSWKRISRIDTPFVERLLQHFGEGATRIGVPDFNLTLANLQRRASS